MASLSSPLSPTLAAPDSIVETIPAVPGLPLIGNLLAFRRDRLALQDQAAALAPLARVQLGPIPFYVCTDADVAHTILVDQADSFQKSAALQFLRPLLGDGLLTAEGGVHKQHRKLLAPAFAPKRLSAYGDVMVEETLAQIGRWRRGERIDLAAEMMQMTLAIAGRTLFGVDVRRDASTVAEALELGMRATVANITSPLRLGYRWPLPRHRNMRRAVAMLDDVVFRLIASGRRLGTDRGDVLSMLLLARDEGDGTGLTDRQVRDEVMTLLLAGHETTANALTWTWYELGRNPDVLAKLVAEVTTVLGDRTPVVDDLPNLPWLAATIDEAMRLNPPVFIIGRQAARPIQLAGHTLPERSIIAVYIRGMHRRAAYYPQPLAFRPERMLPDAKKLRPRHHYLPFGAGPRVCIGAHFALLEAQLALATMIQRVQLRPLATFVRPEPLITLRPRGGLPAIVERC